MIKITENTFCEIFKLSHLIECSTQDLYMKFIEIKDKLQNENQREAALDNLYNFFIEKSGTFEKGDYKDMSFLTFMDEITTIVSKKCDKDFSMNDLKTCLFYFFLKLYGKDEKRWITKDALKNARIGDKKINFVKTGGNFKDSLKLFLDYYFDNKQSIKLPPDLQDDERKSLYNKFKKSLSKMTKQS